MRSLRTRVQVLFVAGTLWLLIRGLLGLTQNTCDTYCPFGGLVALFPLFKHKAYTCRLTELNTALLVSLVVLTLATKKSFCSWICPFGTVSEWLARLGRKVLRRDIRVPGAVDRVLVNLRYVVLVAIVALTWTVWQYDLGFRAYDPFYILFSWGGHGTFPWSFAILAAILALIFVVPFAWCRYLCPLGAVMDPMSRLGPMRVRRNAAACVDCGDCDAACPHRIAVSTADQVTARNCTNCLECVVACGDRKALDLSLAGRRSVGGRSPLGRAIVIPLVIAALIALAFGTAGVYRVPTLERAFMDERPGVVKTVEFEVEGLKCGGVAKFLAAKIADVPGVVAITVYTRTNTAIVEFDPSLTGPEEIRRAYERPDTIEGHEYEVFKTRSVREVH
ncbi:MAG: 4Fe-4S binding protein [Candidatus Eisenbacteria bacterium]|nr:4Fe-4S binding protein [Candidatus Eisenbacteria bacterium]